LEAGVTEPTTQEEKRAGFFRRHKRFFLVAGGVAGLVFLAIVVTVAVVLYKASRVFGRTVPDIVPHDAVLYVEAVALPESWPRVEGFLEGFRKSRSLRTLNSVSPAWRNAGIDRAIVEMLEGLDRVREETGIDPLESLAGTQTALALYLPDPPGEGETAPEGGGKAPHFLFYTRLAGFPVRLAALFPGWVAGRAARQSRGKLEYDGSGPFGTLVLKGSGTPLEFHFAILDDLLVVSSRTELMEQTLALAESEIPTGLATNPLFFKAMEEAAPPAECVFRFWTDFDKFDVFTSIRKNAEFKLTVYPFNYVGQYINELQRGVVDLHACKSVAGWAEIDPGGRIDIEGYLFHGPSGPAPGLAPPESSSPAVSFGSELAPAGSIALVHVRRDFSELWNRLMQGGGGTERGSFDRIMQEHGENIRRILPELGPDLAFFLRPHDDAASPGPDAPLPLTGLAFRCRDTVMVSALLRTILVAELLKIAKNLEESPPFLAPPQRVGEAEISILEGIPEGVSQPICPDFSPGFASWRDRILLFSTRTFAFESIEAGSGGKPSLARDPAYKAFREREMEGAEFTVFIDTQKAADALALPKYRALLAEMKEPLRWEEINREIQSLHGNLPDAELRQRQDEHKRRILARRAQIASEIPRNTAAFDLLRCIGVTGVRLVDGTGAPGGLKARLFLLFDFSE